MFSNICNQVKNKPIQVSTQVKEKVEPLKEKTKIIYPTNKLISCYEEDYTINNKEINQLRQRN